MDDSTEVKIREAIAACRRAGNENRFEDAIKAADDAIAAYRSILQDAHTEYIRLYVVALSLKGGAMLNLRQYQSSLLALEEAYELGVLQKYPPKSLLLDKVTSCLLQVCGILGRDPPLPPLVKFPRTAHLFYTSASAVTDDDLVLPENDSFFKVLTEPNARLSIEEKIDGANLGISLSLKGDILVQNRSHYISSGEHAQFSRLNVWMETNREQIRAILKPSCPSKRRILYGEWVVAKHSIPYGRLPAYFIAFDIAEDGHFVSRHNFHRIMHGSNIPVAPTLEAPNMAGMTQKEIKKALMDLLDTPSHFRDDGGHIEGIVCRIDDEQGMSHRCKLVRHDFISSIHGHWSKSKIVKQRVDTDFAANYMETCYQASDYFNTLPTELLNPRMRARVSYDEMGAATCSMLMKDLSPSDQSKVILPRNLCWLWRDEVLVSSTPKSAEQIKAMQDALNVRLVITLTAEEPPQADWFSSGCANEFYPIVDGMAPSLKTMDEIGDTIVRQVIKNDVRVMEHCGGGKGRAGTVAACLLLRFGQEGIRARLDAENAGKSCRSLRPRQPFMSCEEAIKEIRRRRPGSIETVCQETFVREYAQHLWRKAAAAEDLAARGLQFELSTIHQSSTKRRRMPKFILLAGLPGSGKSSLAKILSQGSKDKQEWTVASTDDLGRKQCLEVVGNVAAKVSQGKTGGIIVDACNISESKRREWCNVMHHPSREATALVFLDVPADICEFRVSHRVDHPTIPFACGRRAVKSFESQLELPTAKEQQQFFGQTILLRSEDDVSSLFSSWGVGVKKED